MPTDRLVELVFRLLLTLGQYAELAAPHADTPAERPRVVMRVSREFLADLTRKQIAEDQPVRTTASGATVVGRAHVAGSQQVKLYPSEATSVFDILVDGVVTTRTTVTRPPVRVQLHGTAPFHASRRVAFDGTAFTPGPPCVGACYRSGLDAVCALRNGPAAPLVRRLARPVVLRSLPEADAGAGRDVREQVGRKLIEGSDEVIGPVNEVLAMRELVHDFLRRRDLPVDRARLVASATEDAIFVGPGGPEGEPARPPVAAEPPARVEIWVRLRLTWWQVAKLVLIRPTLERVWAERLKPKVLERVAKYSPEAAQLLANATHEFELFPVPGQPDWHVIRFLRRAPVDAPAAP